MAYLDWETSLLADIERGGAVPYRNLLWPGPHAAEAPEGARA